MKGIRISNCFYCSYIEGKWDDHSFCRITDRDDREILKGEYPKRPDWCPLEDIEPIKKGGEK